MDSYSKRILITGGCGFIGSHMVIYFTLKYPQYFVVNLDKIDYCSSLQLLKGVEGKPNYHFVRGDILDSDLVTNILETYNINVVLHFAAQTHVDNSFGNSLTFTRNNVLGTHTLLECCKQYGRLHRFIHVSTDEVYGESAFSSEKAIEGSILAPTNPYAATKAGAEHIVLSYWRSWQFPVILTRSNNIYGPHQYPEKVIPKWICLLEKDEKIPVHGDGSHRRSFIYIDDVIEAYSMILHNGTVGEVYNISSDDELSNIELAFKMMSIYGKNDPESMINYVEDRAFNDKRYHINGDKILKMGWTQKVSLETGLKKTIEWYRNNDIRKIWSTHSVKIALQPHPVPSIGSPDIVRTSNNNNINNIESSNKIVKNIVLDQLNQHTIVEKKNS
eukprot:TRINITY_DN2178_c1_g1_i2.p1 TRINITY_DN2178_c1_g1~~TRINITY_DN2178_c1_g1_i2.p1  ORF type:complete len:388 (+),score=71.89 TRINITY_DN2178_c1_g1_i2:1-1164(+)